MHHWSLTLTIPMTSTVLFMASCNAQVASTTEGGADTPSTLQQATADTAQIAAYVVAAFEDSKGNLWFGTVGDGVVRYTPDEGLTYFTTADGLAGDEAPGIVEDHEGHLWFGSHSGATRYDPSAALRTGGNTFNAFHEADGLHGMGCVLLVDSKGNLWAGTNDGAFRFDGTRFQEFDMPIPTIETPSHKWVAGKVWDIVEDSKGNIWFGRDGYGACKYDGKNFTHFTKKDGLCSNNVASIAEDAQGNLWFGSITSDFPPIKEGGLSRYDGNSFTRFPEMNGLTANDIYTVYVDRSGHVWIGAVRVGAYRYDGKTFTLFDRTDRPDLTSTFGMQSVLEDSRGTMWFGFSGGLFRFDGSSFVNVTRGGPWE